MAGSYFTKDGALRVKRAVELIESQGPSRANIRGRQGLSKPLGWWAIITDTDGSGRYSWEYLESDTQGALTKNADWGSGVNTAVETYGSTDVLLDSYVWLEPSRNQDYLIFSYNPGTVVAVLSAGDTITKRTATAPGQGSVLTKYLLEGAWRDWDQVTCYNWSSLDVTSEEDPQEDLWVTLSFGPDGVWWLSGVDCVTE